MTHAHIAPSQANGRLLLAGFCLNLADVFFVASHAHVLRGWRIAWQVKRTSAEEATRARASSRVRYFRYCSSPARLSQGITGHELYFNKISCYIYILIVILRLSSFMWFGSHFTVGVTSRLLLSSSVSLFHKALWNQQRLKNNFHFTSHHSRFKYKTKQVRFYLLCNFYLQFTNKSVGSLCSETLCNRFPMVLIKSFLTRLINFSILNHIIAMKS